MKEYKYMSQLQTLYSGLEKLRKSNPMFSTDNYTINYLNTIADILLLKQPSNVEVAVTNKNTEKRNASNKNKKEDTSTTNKV